MNPASLTLNSEGESMLSHQDLVSIEWITIMFHGVISNTQWKIPFIITLSHVYFVIRIPETLMHQNTITPCTIVVQQNSKDI